MIILVLLQDFAVEMEDARQLQTPIGYRLPTVFTIHQTYLPNGCVIMKKIAQMVAMKLIVVIRRHFASLRFKC